MLNVITKTSILHTHTSTLSVYGVRALFLCHIDHNRRAHNRTPLRDRTTPVVCAQGTTAAARHVRRSRARRTHRTVELQRLHPCGRSHTGLVRQRLFHSWFHEAFNEAPLASGVKDDLRVVYGQAIGPPHSQRTSRRTGHGD